MSRQTIIMALLAVLVAGNAMAQTPPTQTPPPPAQAAVPAPVPVLPPFPIDSKVGFVDLQMVVSLSNLGKAGSAQMEALTKRLEGELVALQTRLRDAQNRQQTQSTLLSEVAAAQLVKDIDRMTRALAFNQEEAQSEMQSMQQDLLQDFDRKVTPILAALAQEKGLHIVFNVAESGAIYVFPGLNLSQELVKRVDAQYTAKQ